MRVYVVDMGRRYLYMRFREPLTGRSHTRSTGCTSRREAERVAAKWEADLERTHWAPGSAVAWDVFVHQYTQLSLEHAARHTERKAFGVLMSYQNAMSPSCLTDVTTATLTAYQSILKRSGRSPATIASHMAHLKAGLRWAHSNGMLNEVPQIPSVRRLERHSRVARGRPLTVREFGRMLQAVPRVVSAGNVRPWRWYLKGLWRSGLRLSESLDLFWDRDDMLRPLLDREYPLLWIPAAREKGNRTRLLPLSPDFVQQLRRVPESDRSGPVFPIPKEKQRRGARRVSPDWVSRRISDIGKAADVVVNELTRKYASAHDLRRSFGDRWSRKLSPADLMNLMRHENIETTMKYYVGQDAERAAERLWKGHS